MTMLVGRAIEAAIQEQIQVPDGEGKKWVFKYTLAEILDSEFRFSSTAPIKLKEPALPPGTSDITAIVDDTVTPYIDTKVFRNTRGAILVDAV